LTVEAERAAVPATWCQGPVREYQPRRLESLIAAAAVRHPYRPALVADELVVSYSDLDLMSRRISTVLSGHGVRPGEYVALLAGHRPASVAALVGVLHAGAAYVPLDPRWPVQRMTAVLAQAASRVVLTDRDHLPQARALAERDPSVATVLILDGVSDEPGAGLDVGDVAELWDYIASDADEYRAAGFNVREAELTPDQIERYIGHVAGLVTARASRAGRTSQVLEIGCGNGLIARAVAPLVGGYLGIDPSSVALDKLAGWARDNAANVTVRRGLADEAARLAGDERFDVILLASVAQFLPSAEYFLDCLDQCARLLTPAGCVIVADVIPPGAEGTGQLALSRRTFTAAALHAQIAERDQFRTGTPLDARYDVILTPTPSTPEPGTPEPSTPEPGTPEPVTFVSAPDILRARPAARPASVDVDAVAYSIFTSGTSGQPKGVVVTHRAVANLIDWVNREFSVTPADRLLFVTSYAFDLSVYDMFGILAAGACLVIPDDDTLMDPDDVASALRAGAVTFWDSAPAALRLVLESMTEASQVVTSVRRVFLSGDWIPLSMIGMIRQCLPNAELIALGGATEATVWSNSFAVGAVDPAWASVPYGRPMQNARYYVLDDLRNHCPVGIAGDLYIAGDCLARGYLGDQQLTDRKFVPDPYAEPGERMYDTGDRARWLPDGTIEFLGRRDNQVKIRGFRIELEDVRSAALTHPEVTQASVVAYGPHTDRDLAVFYTADTRDPAPQALRTHLQAVLPSYMQPAKVIRIPAMPVNANGKVDLAALSAQVTPETP
jgi:amino acid adenylation domain-containing protein